MGVNGVKHECDERCRDVSNDMSSQPGSQNADRQSHHVLSGRMIPPLVVKRVTILVKAKVRRWVNGQVTARLVCVDPGLVVQICTAG